MGTKQISFPNGTPQAIYFAWYELLPAGEVMLSNCTLNSQSVPCTVNPGDYVSAGIFFQGNNVWELDMVNFGTDSTLQTPKWKSVTTVPYSSSKATVEWIVEIPGNAAFPLPNYNSVTFKNVFANTNQFKTLSLSGNGIYNRLANGTCSSIFGCSTPCPPFYKSGLVTSLVVSYGAECRLVPPLARRSDYFPQDTDPLTQIGNDLLWADPFFSNMPVRSASPTSTALALWQMGPSQVLQSGGLGNVPAVWSVIGQRDFNGDGLTDMLWRDSSGNMAIWFMNGFQISSTASLGNVPANWILYGTGDLNGDGKGDLLWRDANSGAVAVWFMNGSQIASTTTFGQVPTSWNIIGSDNNGDVLWRDTAGNVAIWQVNGSQIVASSGLGNVPGNWTIAGMGDFNGDNHIDILWRDTVSGTVAIWFLSGTQVQSTASLGSVSSVWSIADIGDYDGDGMSDVLWIDNTGNVTVWFMNGGQVSSAVGFGNVGTSWQVQSADLK